MCALKGACRPREATLQCGRRAGWKRCRTTWSRFAPFRQISSSTNLQIRGTLDSLNNLAWVLPALKTKGYAILELRSEDLAKLNKLYGQSREFFQRPSKYKENFKFFPIPGGYLTPYPGTYEVFEFRRGLPKCPQELQQAMAAFALLEQIALAICAEIGHEISLELSKMPSETSSAMRCIHYDRPLESRGFGDLQAPTEPPPVGTPVRVVGLAGSLATLNGLKGSVISTSPIVVSLAGAPQAVLQSRGSHSVSVELANLRLLSSQAPGMYPAHTDSSLLTVAPRSSAAGLEVKDLQTGEWFNVEEALSPEECLLFSGDPLDYASGHTYPALMHRPAVCNTQQKGLDGEHRISTPFFLYPRADAVLTPKLLPQMVFDDLNGNVNGCRDRFPWKKHTCYYSDLVYSEHAETKPA